jgi:hypothetical protein
VIKVFTKQRFLRSLILCVITSSSIISLAWLKTAEAGVTAYCQLTPDEIALKEKLRQASLKGDSVAKQNYQSLIAKHAAILKQCRTTTWPQNQAIWLRLYPCDIRLGSIDDLLDRVVNKGYNQVYLEVFFDSRVLLPVNDNPTPWASVVRSSKAANLDLLAQTIQKGHERGLKVYAWMFTLNFGYQYAQLSDRQKVLARNGKGENSLTFVHDQSQAFIDPYHPQAQNDYYKLLNAVMKRRPDGVLFDYVRYPRGTGTQSVASQVQDLWIYGEASQRVLYNRALNNKGRELIARFISRGHITVNDVAQVDQLYPQEGSPLWQGRNPPANELLDPPNIRQQRWQLELWYFTVAHAAQGVLDFVSSVSSLVQRQGVPSGAVFFPDGNQVVGQIGFDSRLQPWDKFSPSMEWHPMSYGICGTPDCIVEQVRRVVNMAPSQTQIVPALAGVWGQRYQNRPSLEEQMQGIRSSLPRINSVSHFAFSWQEPENDKERKFCQIPN